MEQVKKYLHNDVSMGVDYKNIAIAAIQCLPLAFDDINYGPPIPELRWKMVSPPQEIE